MACFHQGMAYGDLPRRTASDKVLRDKAFNVVQKLQNTMNINVDMLQWFIFFSIKRLLVVPLKARLC